MHSSVVAMNWEITRLSIILWVKRGIVFQHNKIINALRQKSNVFFFVHNTMVDSRH